MNKITQNTELNRSDVEKEGIPKFILAFEQGLIGGIAVLSGFLLLILVFLGPLFTGNLQYETSRSGIYQIEGADLANLIFFAPLCFMGGILQLLKKPGAKHILILLPIYLMYNGLSLGIGIEWNNPSYEGNSDHFFWIYLLLIIGGLILLLFVPPMFTDTDIPKFNPKTLKIYCISLVLVLSIFYKMWTEEIVLVLKTGDTINESYQSAPNLFWVIRYLDLGFTIPLGIIGAYLLYFHLKRAYPVIILFFGFFITMIMAVNSMAWTMVAEQDPEVQMEQLVIFGILGILAWTGYLFLIKNRRSEN